MHQQPITTHDHQPPYLLSLAGVFFSKRLLICCPANQISMSRMATSHRFIGKNSIMKIPANQIFPSKLIPEEIPTSITIKVVSFAGRRPTILAASTMDC